jgi:hypothetical protein
MYRLMIVSGPNRGSSYPLHEGENNIGRAMESQIVLSSAKVSKLHCTLLVREDEVFLRDENSTNGTFVNGTQSRRHDMRVGDRVGVGDFIMELMQTHASAAPLSIQGGNTGQFALASAAIHSPAASAPIEQNKFTPTSNAPVVTAPTDLPGKLKFAFEGKLMPTFYGMLMKTEYRSIIAGLLAAVVGVAVVSSVMPMTDLAEKSIRREAMIRARVLAREVADRALPAIAAHNESQVDLSLLEGEDSVKLVTVTNTNLQIIAPQSRLNQMLAGGREAAFAMAMAKEFKEGREKGSGALLDDHTAAFIEPIKINDPRQVKAQVAGMALVSIDFSSNLLETGGLGVAYGTGFVLAGLAAILVYFIILRLSFKPFEVLNDDLDQVLRGELPKVTQEFKMEEIEGLWGNVNAAIQRMPRGGGAIDYAASGDDSPVAWDHEFAPLRALCEAGQDGLVGFDSELNVVVLNPQFEEMSGIRAEVMGQSISQMARDQAFVSLTRDLQDRVNASPSRSALDEFEFSGVAYQTIAAGVGPMGKSGIGLIFRKRG